MGNKLPIAVILIGGANSRFFPLEHKSFLRFGGKNLLERQLEHLMTLGLTDVAIIANPSNASLTKETLTRYPMINHRIALQNTPNGMGAALLSLEPVLGMDLEGPVYILQPSDVVEKELHQKMLNTWQHSEAQGLLAGCNVSEHFPGGYLVTDKQRVTGIVEKPSPRAAPSNIVTFVSHIHPSLADLLTAIREEYSKQESTDDHYERAVSKLAARYLYQMVEYTGPWVPIKYPWHVLDAMRFFLNQTTAQRIAPSAQISSRAEITGNVIIEEGVRVLSGAHIVGPSFIGARSVVGDNALVRESMIGENSVIGYSTEVARSYVGSGTWFHSNYVGDSIVDDEVSLGSGTVTANLRFDEKPIQSMVGQTLVETGKVKFGTVIGRGCRTGINVSILPGVKIGRDSWISPGVCVTRDVPARRYVTLKQELEQKPNVGFSSTHDREDTLRRLMQQVEP